MKFKDAILTHNPEIEVVPSGFQRYDDMMILRSTQKLSSKLGETVLNIYPWCKGVFQHTDTKGERREPELVHLAGTKNTEVIHKENGVEYIIDLDKITFSGGNRGLRERLVKQTKNGEKLLDLFAAVGNLSLQPIIKRDIDPMLIERNPYTFDYLVKTLIHNNLPTNIAHNMDCRDLKKQAWANRIFMGYHGVNRSHLKTAINAASVGCKLHLHPIVSTKNWDKSISQFQTWFDQLGVKVTMQNKNQIKSFSPNLEHIELIYQIEEKQ